VAVGLRVGGIVAQGAQEEAGHPHAQNLFAGVSAARSQLSTQEVEKIPDLRAGISSPESLGFRT
jgi:hypothetical protein